MVYDCIVIGAGPSGSVCSYLLTKKGFRCAILEKRSFIDEKVCGGFVPDRCRSRLVDIGISLDELYDYSKIITMYTNYRQNEKNIFCYSEGKYGLGVFREKLDSFLLMQSVNIGTDVFFNQTVHNYSFSDGVYIVNGFYAKNIIFAIGAQGCYNTDLVPKKLLYTQQRKQSVGISEIITVKSTCLDNNSVHFWYDFQSKDYFWAIPILTNTWNIGYWSQLKKNNINNNFIEGRAKYIESSCKGIAIVRNAKGALLGNVDYSDQFTGKSVFCCGDIAGRNNITTGEGIMQAIESAIEISDKISRGD